MRNSRTPILENVAALHGYALYKPTKRHYASRAEVTAVATWNPGYVLFDPGCQTCLTRSGFQDFFFFFWSFSVFLITATPASDEFCGIVAAVTHRRTGTSARLARSTQTGRSARPTIHFRTQIFLLIENRQLTSHVFGCAAVSRYF